MAATTGNKAKLSLKLMVHKEDKRVIFAEADSNFVDILFSFMTLPLGTIIRLLEKPCDDKVEALGSLRNLYKSLVNLPDVYLSSVESKFVMLNPRSSSFDLCRKLKLNIDDTEPIKYFLCLNCFPNKTIISTCNFSRCSCGNLINREIKESKSSSNTGFGRNDDSVFVSNVTTFIITDDLRVMPNTSGFVMQLLHQYGITEVSHVEEMTFDIGFEQILMLLNSALIFKYPLTYMVFASTNLSGGLSLSRASPEPLLHHFIKTEQGTPSKKLSLKVTMQKSTLKFLFAEADSDFVDFVYGFLELPLGTVIGELLNGTSSLESMDNLYASISNKLVGKCIKSQDLKDRLFQPQLVLKYLSQNQIFPVKAKNSYINFDPVSGITVALHHCAEEYYPSNLKDPRVKERYLKSPAKFMLTDDLVITPLSSTSTLAVLSKLKVSIADIEEHEVVIGIEEGLKILKASLKSVSTLTEALLKEIVKNKI